MNEKPLVSVIINCFNGEKYLREAIDSVMNQTYHNWEIVLWDNQSIDSTKEIVESYHDARIKYYYAPVHTSLGKARNLALEKIEGAFVCFLDSDDVWEKNWVETFVSRFEQDQNISLVFCRFVVDFCDHSRLNKTLLPNVDGYLTTEDFIDKYSLGMSGSAIRASVIGDEGIRFNESFSLIEDYDFFIRIASLGAIYFYATPFFHYREHGDNLSHKAANWSKEFITLRDLILGREATYESLVNHIDALNRKIETYKFIDLTINKKYLKAFFKHPRTFLYWLKDNHKR